MLYLSQRYPRTHVTWLWRACCGLLLGGMPLVCADTLSPAVGLVRVTATVGQTLTLANPFAADAHPASTVAATATPGDLLHLWTGTAFNSYLAEDGGWVIAGTAAPLPAARLNPAPGNGCLVTRQDAAPWTIVFTGPLRDDTSTPVTTPAASWSLVSCPYPVALTLAQLTAAGATAGDLVRAWQPNAQAWLSFNLSAAGWTGPDAGALTLPAGTAFLFYNAAGTAKTLTFPRPP